MTFRVSVPGIRAALLVLACCLPGVLSAQRTVSRRVPVSFRMPVLTVLDVAAARPSAPPVATDAWQEVVVEVVTGANAAYEVVARPSDPGEEWEAQAEATTWRPVPAAGLVMAARGAGRHPLRLAFRSAAAARSGGITLEVRATGAARRMVATVLAPVVVSRRETRSGGD